MQVDLFEVVYRCAKGGLGEMAYQQHVNAQVRAPWVNSIHVEGLVYEVKLALISPLLIG